jgi:cytoskeletal protein CcmA (bactofilin family)
MTTMIQSTSPTTSHSSGPSTGPTKRTLIEEGTELKGTLTSTCPIVVQGRVEGDLSGPSVEVTESGVLSGKAKVTELRSRGEIAGEFDAKVVELSGRVRDKTVIRAESLEVKLRREEGRIEMVFGDCELAIGDASDKAKAVAAARANGQAKAKPAAPSATAAAPAPATPSVPAPSPPAPATDS